MLVPYVPLMERDAVGIQGLSIKTEFQSCYALLDMMLVYPRGFLTVCLYPYTLLGGER